MDKEYYILSTKYSLQEHQTKRGRVHPHYLQNDVRGQAEVVARISYKDRHKTRIYGVCNGKA